MEHAADEWPVAWAAFYGIQKIKKKTASTLDDWRESGETLIYVRDIWMIWFWDTNEPRREYYIAPATCHDSQEDKLDTHGYPE
jgi:hypothetical protein